MNLRLAISASSHHLACRQISDRRLIVDHGQGFLTVHIQRRSKRHWIVDDDGGGVRYLAGVQRDGMGRYLYLLSLSPSDDLSAIERIRTLLPLSYQALLSPTSDDWHAIERGDL